MQVCVLVVETIESAHPGYHTGTPLHTHHHCTSCMKQHRCNEWGKNLLKLKLLVSLHQTSWDSHIYCRLHTLTVSYIFNVLYTKISRSMVLYTSCHSMSVYINIHCHNNYCAVQACELNLSWQNVSISIPRASSGCAYFYDFKKKLPHLNLVIS